MKNKRIVKIITFIFVILLLSINRSYAAIEIKDTTSPVFTNKTISEFYDMTEEMKNPGQGLEGSNIDVKMANNYEWAAVSYFSNSIYGTATAGQNTGVQLENSTHLSTNGNITGIMDWGKTQSFTAGIIAGWKDSDGTIKITDETTLSNGKSIISNAETNRVDKIRNFSYGTDMVIAVTGWYNATHFGGGGANQPFSYRSGIFGFYVGAGDANGASSRRTFRPIFYAQ